MNGGPTPDADLQPLRLGELLALGDFEAGRAGARAWHDLDDMARVAAELAVMGIGPEVLPLARAAIRVLHTVATVDPPLRIDAADLAPLLDLQDAHDQQRRLASRAEFIEANARAISALRAGGSRLSVPAALQGP